MRFHYFIVLLFAAAALAGQQSQSAESPATPQSVFPSAHQSQGPINSVSGSFQSLSAGAMQILEDMPDHLKVAAEKVHALKDSAHAGFEHLKGQMVSVNYEELPKQAKDYIQNYVKEHPYQTAFHVLNGVIFIAPTALTSPVLSALGFTAVGPRTASLASSIMSKYGTGPARGAYAMVQSAAMGGYGVAPVAGITRVGTVLAEAARLWKPAQHKKDQPESMEVVGGRVKSKL